MIAVRRLKKGARIVVRLNSGDECEAILKDPQTGMIKVFHLIGLRVQPVAGEYTCIGVIHDGPGSDS